MSTIALHLNGAVFSPDIMALLEEAYERVCHSVNAPSSVKKIIALRILELAIKGERDPSTLCRETLADLHVEGDSGPR